MNNILTLSKLKIKLFFKKISNLVLISMLLILFIILNGLGSVLIKGTIDFGLIYINILIALNSLIFATFIVFLSVKTFNSEIRDGISSIELRYGCKTRELFLSRLISSLLLILIFFTVSVIINIIFIASTSGFINIFAYRLYISALGWYAISSFIIFAITLLITLFLNEILSGILSIIFFVLLILSSAMGPMFFKDLGVKDSKLNYPKIIYKNIRDSDFLNTLKSLDQEFLDWIAFKNKVEYNSDINNISNDINKLTLGPSIWTNKIELGKEYPTLVQFYDYFDNYFNNPKNNHFSYDDIVDFNTKMYTLEPLEQLFKNILLNVDTKYQKLIKMMYQQNANIAVLTELSLDYQWSFDVPQNIKSVAQQYNISADKILFFKTFNYSLKRIKSSIFRDGIIGKLDYKDIPDLQKKNLMLNPILQIAAMFQSINYRDFYLDNAIAASGIIFSNTINYNILEYPLNNNTNFETNIVNYKRNFHVEVLYVIYFLLNSALIWILYLQFKKKVYIS
ncbi:hypothetical protein SSYRP_v1c07060 [Spiroplasma syrphidicola EA-1]|uniref:Uncharacterized protein n=1 Tax=Spiroplasma syrphidicola EA-1 TaxID=1276229 RepID=R4UM36_9MOLU|nr:hypothetical protein [Spiroplasma syrphidicola]AGM26296.1 hypothetical protein SSYRP_v1c07060 [Spiroplasma syrphidicola EA-1]